MKFVIAVCLLAAPLCAQTSWQWRYEMRRVQADARRAHVEAMRSVRMAHAEAARSAVRMRAEALREAAHARLEARRAVEDARRALRESYRHERIWRL